jgi:hypothetical protein
MEYDVVNGSHRPVDLHSPVLPSGHSPGGLLLQDMARIARTKNPIANKSFFMALH